MDKTIENLSKQIENKINEIKTETENKINENVENAKKEAQKAAADYVQGLLKW